MKKQIITLAGLLMFLCFTQPAIAGDDDNGDRRGFTVGFGPIGNFYLIDTTPIMDPGIGGYVYFDYRFHPQVAFETSFFISSQDGTNISKGDGNILLLGIPTFDIKLYFREGNPSFDPYATTGIGVYILTEGTVANSTGGAGMGAQVGLGFDYYLTSMISLGMQGTFRSVSVISDFGTPSKSAAIFPYSVHGNVSFHF
ncbi:MAG: outer membrane beta-barrel protein [Deltaproteobacteria bacterium]|nr:outer membrane beta-barrel protein [Deltaproteobacteria bacterium]